MVVERCWQGEMGEDDVETCSSVQFVKRRPAAPVYPFLSLSAARVVILWTTISIKSRILTHVWGGGIKQEIKSFSTRRHARAHTHRGHKLTCSFICVCLALQTHNARGVLNTNTHLHTHTHTIMSKGRLRVSTSVLTAHTQAYSLTFSLPQYSTQLK